MSPNPNQPMIEAVRIPSGTVTFETGDGVKFAVPVMELNREIRALSDRRRAEGADHFDFLAEVGVILKERFGVDLTLDQVDWFKDQLEIEHAKKKQRQVSDLKGTLNSLYSMASTASPPGE